MFQEGADYVSSSTTIYYNNEPCKQDNFVPDFIKHSIEAFFFQSNFYSVSLFGVVRCDQVLCDCAMLI
jgi:hypothetical protein